MSRSRRKTPIFGNTKQRSERQDKQLWHRRWRARERTALTSASPEALDGYQTITRNQVSSTWLMDKDGHLYWSDEFRAALAKRFASEQGCTPRERAALETRLLRKWMAK